MKKTAMLAFFITILCANSYAAMSDSLFYDIKFTIKGIKHSKAMLGYYIGERIYMTDSAIVDTKTGTFQFHSNKKQSEGVYFVATTEGVIFDMILAQENIFSITTTYTTPYDSAKIEGSLENIAFFDYLKKSKETQNEITKIRSAINMLRRAKADRATINEQELKIRENVQSLDAHIQNIISKNPELLTSKLLRISTISSIPTDIKPFLENKKPNPAYRYYFWQHFFDGVDFTDKRLLRSHFYTDKLEQFLGYLPTNSDSVKIQLDFLLQKTKINIDYYQFTLKWLTAVFDKNLEKMVNADNYLIYLVQKYHHDSNSGTDKYTLERLDYKANAFKNALIGNPAPLFSLPDTEGVQKSLTDIKSDYTLLVFYSSMCAHCREAMPRIREAVQYIDPSKLQVLAICSDGNRTSWLTFLEEMKMKNNWINVLDSKNDSDIQKQYATWNLPVMYLLDTNKVIIAKRLKAENLPDVLKELFSNK